MSKNKKIGNNEDMSFYEKMKTDKRYNAKVQFIAYGVFILLLIVFINISSINNSGNINTLTNNNEEKEDNKLEELSMLEMINDNYEYDIKVKFVKNETNTVNYRYYGKSFGDNIEISKEVNNEVDKYYEVDGYYYTKNDNEEFDLIQSSIIYDLIDNKYLELDDILNIIKKASLDHVVDSSNQTKESVYNLLVRDLVISNKSDDVVIIRVVEDNEELHINIDYTNLLKALGNDILECEVDYVYTNVNGVEEFKVMNKENVGD